MAFSDWFKGVLLARLREKNVPKACPLCGVSNWIMTDSFVPVTVSKKVDIVQMGGEGQVLPMVTLVCGNCGNTVFFNLKRLGLVDEAVKEGSGNLAGKSEASPSPIGVERGK